MPPSGELQVRLADDLDQRRAGPIEIDQAAALGVRGLAGVLLQVDALELGRSVRRPSGTRPPMQSGSSYWLIW